MYRAVWNRIKQYWTEERWIRVTAAEDNLRWVGMNVPQTDAFGGVVGVQNPFAELDVDIIMQDAPDSVTIQSEQFELLVDMWTKAPDRIPLELIIEASSLRSNIKQKLLEIAKTPPPPNPVQERGAMAEIAKTESEAAKNFATAEKTAGEARRGAVEAQLAAEFGAPIPLVGG